MLVQLWGDSGRATHHRRGPPDRTPAIRLAAPGRAIHLGQFPFHSEGRGWLRLGSDAAVPPLTVATTLSVVSHPVVVAVRRMEDDPLIPTDIIRH